MALIWLATFLSGFCALIYQVAWVRILTVDFGNTIYAISVVLSVFMAGLAGGGYVFGRCADRAGNALALYAGLELALAVYTAVFVAVIPEVHRLIAWSYQVGSIPGALSGVSTFFFALMVLLVPSVLMGGTLPVLAKVVANSPATSGSRLSKLYGLNTLGAVCGCLGTAYLFIVLWGVSGSMLLGAGINGILGLLTGWVSWKMRQDFHVPHPHIESPTYVEPARSEPQDGSPRSSVRWQVIAFSSGFLVLATEVIWTRLFTSLLTANVLIFATIVAALLTGLSVGSFLVSLRIDRLGRLDMALGMALCASALWLIGSVTAQSFVGTILARSQRVQFEAMPAVTTYVCLGTLFALVVVPCATFGAVFPLLFGWATRSVSTRGRDVGRLYAVNTLGGIGGALVSGFLLIHFLGINGSLLVLAGYYAVLALFTLRDIRHRLVPCALLVVCLLVAVRPAYRQPIHWINEGFEQVSRIPKADTLFLEEGIQATVGVGRIREARVLTVNGLIVAETSQRDLWDLLLKAHLPMLLHARPRDVAVIGLGAGVSLGAIQAHDDVLRIDCVELFPEVERAHRWFAMVNKRCWEDDRLHMHIDDGRHFLLTTKRHFDVISVDPVDPPVCDLYSQDFFRLCHDRLRTGGYMVQWLPLFRLHPEHLRIVMAAFLRVFPQTTVWYDGTSALLIARRERAVQIDLDQFRRRAARDRVVESLSMIGSPSPDLILGTFVMGPQQLTSLLGPQVTFNTDDRPYLEYTVLRGGRTGNATLSANLEMLLRSYQPIEELFPAGDRHADRLSGLRQAQSLIKDLLRARIHFLRGQTSAGTRHVEYLLQKYELNRTDLRRLRPFLRVLEDWENLP